MKNNDFHGEVWINAHEEILHDLVKANEVPIDGGYGNDGLSKLATEFMQKNFKTPIYTTFTISGTAANVMAMKAMLDRWSSIICAKQTHINCYEAGAFEFNLGNKIITIDTFDGKINPELIEKCLIANRKYKYRPKVITMAQPTEFGTVYTNEELKAICDYAHVRGMYVYIDGARIGNAVVALGTNLKEMIEDTGVDGFSFGGTKAGAMFGEMIVFMRKEFAENLDYSQKQSIQHMAKSKFLGVQIATILREKIWLKDAEKSNDAAKTLERKLREKGVKIYYPVQSNMVFCVIPPEKFTKVCEKYEMHYWEEATHVVRLATTYLTTKEQMDAFVALI